MKVQVAVIGPTDLVGLVMKMGQDYPQLKLLPAGYKHEQDTMQVIEAVSHKAEVLLFTGPIPYQIALQHAVKKPMVHVPYTETALYRVLFQIFKYQSTGRNGHPLMVGIDVLQPEIVEERFEELDLSSAHIFIKEYQTGMDTDEFIQFHQQLWAEQQVEVIITCITSVYEKLKQLKVPVFRVVPTKSSIRNGLQMVVLEGKNLRSSDTQIAVGMINIDDFSKKVVHASSEYDIQRKKLALQQLMIDYGEETQALINWSASDEVTFITTRGIIERSTQNFTTAPLLAQITHKLNLRASLGIGLGRTANEAEGKAREALLKAKSTGGGSCYLVMQDGMVFGPLGSEFLLGYSVRSDDPEHISLSKKSGLSIGTINRLISLCVSFKRTKMTASELAEGFGITLRSARRILSTLEQNKLAEVVGEEQPVGRGRPRQIYKLNLNIKNEKLG